jgi:predicted glycosyltransferase
MKVWEKQGYHDAIRSFYDLVLVVGSPEILDLREEYSFPFSVAEKVEFCGYLRRELGRQADDGLRQELRGDAEKLVLVTAGGGEDGYRLLATYLAGLAWLPAEQNIRSVIVCGPEMPQSQRAELYQAAAQYPQVRICEFADDMLRYMDAADVIVSMGGYNTICEILSLHKRAIIVPRVKPVTEQWIRAKRMARRGLVHAIHPDVLTPENLIETVLDVLKGDNGVQASPSLLDLGGLPRLTQYLEALLDTETSCTETSYAYERSTTVHDSACRGPQDRISGQDFPKSIRNFYPARNFFLAAARHAARPVCLGATA